MTALTGAAEPAPAPSPFTSKQSSPQQLMSPSYAQSGKILFAAAVLVCALLPAALCARAYRRRRAADDAVERSTDCPGTLASLPVISYTPTMEEEVECTVCLSALEKGEQVRTLPGCGHLFHLGCINAWLLSHSTCPLCRSPVAAVTRSQPTAVAALSVPPAVCERRGDSLVATSAGARVKLSSTSRVLLLAGMLFSIELGLARAAEGGGSQTGQVDLERREAAELSSMSPRSLEDS